MPWFREGIQGEVRKEQALPEVSGAVVAASCPLSGCQIPGVSGHVGVPRGAPHQVGGWEGVLGALGP